MSNELKQIPKVGEILDFYDDGKTSESRHYKGIVTHIIPFTEGNKISNLFIDVWDDKDQNILLERKSHTLIEVWEQSKINCDWLFASETDYFIGFACPEYDEHILWFARTKDGGWFSMDIQSWWQGGRLDIDGSLTKYVQEERELYIQWKKDQEKKEQEIREIRREIRQNDNFNWLIGDPYSPYPEYL